MPCNQNAVEWILRLEGRVGAFLYDININLLLMHLRVSEESSPVVQKSVIVEVMRSIRSNIKGLSKCNSPRFIWIPKVIEMPHRGRQKS